MRLCTSGGIGSIPLWRSISMRPLISPSVWWRHRWAGVRSRRRSIWAPLILWAESAAEHGCFVAPIHLRLISRPDPVMVVGTAGQEPSWRWKYSEHPSVHGDRPSPRNKRRPGRPQRRAAALVLKVRKALREREAMRACDSYIPTKYQGAAVREAPFLVFSVKVTGGIFTHPPIPPHGNIGSPLYLGMATT